MDSINHPASIAVIGMSGEFPGAKNVDEYWHNICDGVESVKILNKEEAREAGATEELLNSDNFVSVTNRLENTDMFDAEFFGYSSKESKILDPQQRLLLKHAHWALENAGHARTKSDLQVGIYAGIGFSTYLLNHIFKNPESQKAVNPMQLMIANDKDYAATRVAYKLGLTGPAVNVGTACSTSLVAIHLACRSLLGYETDVALAGGVKVDLLYHMGQNYQQGGIFSSDGHTRAFDASASGTTFGDGAGLVVLKRLSDALENGDHIHAIIRGSAVNNDGDQKVGYTAPSITSQAEVISMAQTIADVSSNSIGYVEAHGTGTPLGDPIEVAALSRAFQAKNHEGEKCALGSVKTNIGHLDVASGVAGFIKALQAVKFARIPPSLHYQQPNPEIDFESSPFYVNSRLSDWVQDQERRAAVSSFGVGGTNAHLILEQAPEQSLFTKTRSVQTLQFSAKSAESLLAINKQMQEFLSHNTDIDLAQLAYTLRVGRNDYQYRNAIVCSSHETALARLQSLGANGVETQQQANTQNSVIFMFPGQGSQYVGMAASLCASEPYFAAQIDHCCELFEELLDCPLKQLLLDENQSEDELTQTQYAQPALFTVEYALARTLMFWGIKPKAMVGHSLGEYVAACLAGVFSLEDAAKIVASRGQLMQAQPPGKMLAVNSASHEIEGLLIQEVSVAAINSPKQCVLSGSQEAIQTQAEKFTRMGIPCREINTSHAFHHASMTQAANSLSELLKSIELNKPKARFISNLTGNWIKPGEATDPDYWAEHLLSPVRFSLGLDKLAQMNVSAVLEVGPGKALSGFARVSLSQQTLICQSIPDVRNKQQASELLHESLGKIWCIGIEPDWQSFYQYEKLSKTPVPGYVFNEQRHWVEPLSSSLIQAKPKEFASVKNENVSEWFYAPIWKQSILPEAKKHAGNKRLVMLDKEAIGESLLDETEQTVWVSVGSEFQKLSENRFKVRPGIVEDWQKLIAEIDPEQNAPLDLINFWPLDVKGSLPLDVKLLEENKQLLFDSLVILVQKLKAMAFNRVRVFNICRGINGPFANSIQLPFNQMCHGLGTVVTQEAPNFEHTVVELGIDSQFINLKSLLSQELHQTTNSPFISYRADSRWELDFQQISQSAEKPEIKPNGLYVITGGIGDVGSLAAKALAKMASVKICFISRSGVPGGGDWRSIDSDVLNPKDAKKIERAKEIETLGSEVIFAEADVTDAQSLESALRDTQQRYGAIKGVVHGAGVYDFNSLDTITKETAESVFAPKVQGVEVLGAILEKVAHPDFCILLSSVSSFLGGFGYAAYAAANAYLDGYCAAQRARGKNHWFTLNWDAFNLDTEQANNQTALMKTAISASEGELAFEKIFSNLQYPQLIISTTPFKSRYQQWVSQKQGNKTQSKRTDVQVSDKNMDAIESKIFGIWCNLFDSTDIGLEDDFFSLGGDSLLGMSFVSEFKKEFGVNIYVRALFEAPTIAQQCEYFKNNYSKEAKVLLGEEKSDSTIPDKLKWEDYLEFGHQWSKKREFPSELNRNIKGRQVFILSPPRSGSTLLRVMLAGHGRLVSPPELELLCFTDMQSRLQEYSGDNAYRNGGLEQLLSYLHHSDAEEVSNTMQQYIEDNSIAGVYEDLHQRLDGQLLIDKSPVYSHNIEILERAESLFDEPLYIFLQRHPGGMVNSYAKTRIDLLTQQNKYTPEQLGELQWNLTSRTIETFLSNIPAERQLFLRYEDLVDSPQKSMESVCQFLDVDYDAGMLEPYADAERLMTDKTRFVGDPNFHLHNQIDSKSAYRWQTEFDVKHLSDFTASLASQWGYSTEVEEDVTTPVAPENLDIDLDSLSDDELDNLISELSE